MNLLCIADEDSRLQLPDLGAGCRITHSLAADALALLDAAHFDAAVVRTPVADFTPAGIVTAIRRVHSDLPVLVISGENTAVVAFCLAQAGADAVLDPDATAQDVCNWLVQTSGRLRSKDISPAPAQAWHSLLIGESKAMRTISEVVRLVGPRRCTVLITGETGTGKEMIARAIHMASERSRNAMVAVNCTALPDQLLEAELFGHVRGAFTGAANHRVGRFEQAHRGTLFLDEIGDMPVELQTKLLRVLQEREFQRVGSSETVKVDVRFVAASNADLEREIEDGQFREDLYYRLNVVPIRMPPLRERPEDIPLLAHHFIEKVCRSEDIPLKRITREALDNLESHDWPGNVRQLENAVETAVVLSGERPMLSASDFRLGEPAARKSTALQVLPFVSLPDQGLDFERTVGRIEREILEQALKKTNGNKKRAAEMLRLKRTTLAAKLKSLESIAC